MRLSTAFGGARGLRPLRSSRSAIGVTLTLLCAGAACNRSATQEANTETAASPARQRGETETRAAGPTPGGGDAGTAPRPSARGVTPTEATTQPGPKPTIVRERYAWLAGGAVQPAEVEPLDARYAPPTGFTRVRLPAGSFGEWLRGLPLAAPGTPVRTYRGDVRYGADDRRIAAVVAIDVGTADLQQCADTVMRLHGEWAWSRGRRDMTYDAAAGMRLPYTRFARGERVAMDGGRLVWKPGRPAATGYAGFREFMNMVFAWSNTVSLSRQAAEVPPADVRPGDFFVLPGNPGHTVLILDLARDANGNAVALIGQSYMPAQSFYVLRGDRDPWFSLQAGESVDTPFWEPFPWDSLRRLDG